MTNSFWPPWSPDVFGPLVAPSDVRDAVKATLQLWSPSYIAEIATRKDLTLPPIEDWTVRPEYRSLPVTSAPACMVTCGGTLGSPHREGDGNFLVHYGVQVSVVVFGPDWEPTEDLTGNYATALTAALLQNPSLGDFAQGVDWLSYRYLVVEHSSTRTLGTGQISLDVGVRNVVNAKAGPSAPTDPADLPPTVETSSVAIVKETP